MVARRPYAHWIASALSVALASLPAAAKDLSVALSESVVAITTQFAGADLLLFGAKQGKGDVVVVVRGPVQDQTVRRKDRVAGIWINRAEIAFDRIPAFYAVAANRPITDFMPRDTRQRHQIGVDFIDLTPKEKPSSADELRRFREALIRNKQAAGLYSARVGNVQFLTDQLFSTRIHFPANVIVGTFGVDVHLVRDGEIALTETKLINVRKIGVEASVYDFAHRQSFAYGILAIVIAVVAGWAANAAFKKK